MRSYTTPQSILRNIPLNAPNHDVRAAFGRGNYKAWDWSKITKCITTAGGANSSHPSGQRSLTHREFAALMSYPLEHIFYGNAVRRQVGNSVPPMIAKIIFVCVRKHLQKVDGFAPEDNVVTLDD